MEKYLLDSTAPIDYLRHRREAIDLIDGLWGNGHQLAVCAIGVAEVYAGVHPHIKGEADRLFERLDYFDITPEMAVEAGRYRYQFARHGISLSTQDTLTAAVAIANDATLITNNLSDFPMDGIRLLSHRQD